MKSDTEPRTAGSRISLRLHDDDNVATLLDDDMDCVSLEDGTVIEKGIPFGHKVALQPIAAGAAVIKYGVTIGKASCDIKPGVHVHVHNVACF